ncbi:hemolysin D [Aliidongia dinghuensis]|uniref:Hemolysin D n=1 Tax=Aliidongia dinghuensis TaxID=1867774 RepID=A0A8J3E5R3_9PROT|nr:efflux RND transporter periplasmic adaptor subunit [Aliidongia dinghuensis]GGF49654.1 hemolysin D [Aliidongia dinghuensis]
MKMPLLLLAAALAAPLPNVTKAALADDAPASVLVSTVPVKQGSVAETIVAYGVVGPAPDGTANISLLRAGQVLKLRVAPGETIRKGDPLVDFGADPATIATYDQAVSALAAAKDDRTRTAELLAQQLATRAQLTQADKAVADARSALDALDRSGGGKPVETIAAPFDGVVLSIAVGPGDRIQPSAPLMQLARADAFVVSAGIEPAQRAMVAAGAAVHLAALDGKAPALEGTIASVAGMIDPKTRLVDAQIHLSPATVQAALPGAGYRATIETGQLKGWIAPREAVLLDGGAHVFQVAGGKAKTVPVRIVGEVGDMSVLDGPLEPGAPLVVSGNYQLSDGAAVREQSAVAEQGTDRKL